MGPSLISLSSINHISAGFIRVNILIRKMVETTKSKSLPGRCVTHKVKWWGFNGDILQQKKFRFEFCGRFKEDGKENIHTGLLADCCKVTLSYPLHPEYQVVCPSLQCTNLWLKEFYSAPRAKPKTPPQPNPEPEELKNPEKGSDTLPEIVKVESIAEN